MVIWFLCLLLPLLCLVTIIATAALLLQLIFLCFRGLCCQFTLSNHFCYFMLRGSAITPQQWLKAAEFDPRYILCVFYRAHLPPTTSALPTVLISSWWTRTSSVSYPQKEVSCPHLLQILGEPSLPLLPGNGCGVRGKLREQCRQNVPCWNKIKQIETPPHFHLYVLIT